jgi:hypothetical protein
MYVFSSFYYIVCSVSDYTTGWGERKEGIFLVEKALAKQDTNRIEQFSKKKQKSFTKSKENRCKISIKEKYFKGNVL